MGLRNEKNGWDWIKWDVPWVWGRTSHRRDIGNSGYHMDFHKIYNASDLGLIFQSLDE